MLVFIYPFTSSSRQLYFPLLRGLTVSYRPMINTSVFATQSFFVEVSLKPCIQQLLWVGMDGLKWGICSPVCPVVGDVAATHKVD